MAEKDVQVSMAVDTEKMTTTFADLKAAVEQIGQGLTLVYEQAFKPTIEAIGKVTMPNPPPITPEQIAHAYGVPPEMLGLLPPDAGEQLQVAVTDGSLSSEAVVWLDGGTIDYAPSWVKDQAIHAWDDTGVLEMGECPANCAPYVSGQLGINSMFVNQQPSGWQTKTAAEILADVQAAAKLYMGNPMPKKTFKAPVTPEGEPKPNMVMAHEVFTSPLIHTPEQAAQTGKDLLAKYQVKATGDVEVNQLDEQGNPTGKWITLGKVSDFNLEPLLSANEYKLAQGWPPEPQTFTLKYPFNDLSQPGTSFHQKLIEEKLMMVAQAEKEMLGASLGVDVSKSSGNTVTVQSNPVDPGVVQVLVYGPDGEPVKQALIPLSEIEAMATAAEKMITVDPIQTGTPWHEGWGYQHQELGHEEAFAEALDQHEKVTKLQAKIFNVLGKDQPVVVTGLSMHSTTHKLAHGGTLIEYPDGVATLDLPGVVYDPDNGHGQLHGKFTLVTEQARKIAGLDSLGPDDTLDATIQWLYGKPYVWHPDHGWIPKAEVSAVSTALIEDEELFEPVPEPSIHPQAHLWCTACDVHWLMHTGDPVECESGGYLRPSTPLEDKQILIRIQMLKDTGLL